MTKDQAAALVVAIMKCTVVETRRNDDEMVIGFQGRNSESSILIELRFNYLDATVHLH